jgi:hypothetical protein
MPTLGGRRRSGLVVEAMFERFTEKAIKVVMLAQEEARRLGHNFVGTEQVSFRMRSIAGWIWSRANRAETDDDGRDAKAARRILSG